MTTASLPEAKIVGNVAVAVSTMASEISDLAYNGQAGAEIAAHDLPMSGGVVQNPVKFAHELAGIYLKGAGEYLHTLGNVLATDWAPLLGTATLARGALEYAAKSWWLQRPNQNGPARVGRVMGAMRGDFEQQAVTNAALAEMRQQVEEWASGQSGYALKRGEAKITSVIAEMEPDLGEDGRSLGREGYSYLSDIAHGGPLTVLRHIGLSQQPPGSDVYEQWNRALIACRSGLHACAAMIDMRGDDGTSWSDVVAAYNYYAEIFDAVTIQANGS